MSRLAPTFPMANGSGHPTGRACDLLNPPGTGFSQRAPHLGQYL